MLFRKAVAQDLEAITSIYDAIHTEEAAGRMTTGWLREIYPTRQTAKTAINLGEMYVLALDDGTIAAALRLNQHQESAYALVPWHFPAPDSAVMVMHTLTVDPAFSGRHIGTEAVTCYEHFAREHGCRVLRIDTNERNTRARRMYARLGYREAGIVPTEFNGIPGVQLVCLEKLLPED